MPPSVHGCKINVLPEDTWDYELSAGSGDDSYLSPLVINGYLQIDNLSGIIGSINSHTLLKKIVWVN